MAVSMSWVDASTSKGDERDACADLLFGKTSNLEFDAATADVEDLLFFARFSTQEPRK